MKLPERRLVLRGKCSFVQRKDGMEETDMRHLEDTWYAKDGDPACLKRSRTRKDLFASVQKDLRLAEWEVAQQEERRNEAVVDSLDCAGVRARSDGDP